MDLVFEPRFLRLRIHHSAIELAHYPCIWLWLAWLDSFIEAQWRLHLYNITMSFKWRCGHAANHRSFVIHGVQWKKLDACQLHDCADFLQNILVRFKMFNQPPVGDLWLFLPCGRMSPEASLSSCSLAITYPNNITCITKTQKASHRLCQNQGAVAMNKL